MTGRKNEGFTLVELMVSILAASIVTLAATTILLLGMRINHQSSKVVTQQTTTRILMSALENMAAEGVIDDVAQTNDGGWVVIREVIDEAAENQKTTDEILVYVEGAEGTGEIKAKDTVLLDGIISSSINMEESGLLTCMVETEDGKYEMTVYCRTVDTAKTEARNAKRNAFLQTLVSQLYSDEANKVPNEGKVNGTGAYYYQWYIGYTGEEITNSEWTPETPWCAMLVSWGLAQIDIDAPTEKWFSHVDDADGAKGFVSYLQIANSEGHRWRAADGKYIPVAGDLIFFQKDADTQADHMGVVISVAGGYVYTIEGNAEIVVEIETVDEITGETVTVTETKHVVKLNKYELTHETILGYGVLNWD